MKRKPLFSLVVIVAAYYMFGLHTYAQEKSPNKDGFKSIRINQRAYYQKHLATDMILLIDSASKKQSFPENRYEMLKIIVSKGMDFREAIVKVLGKEKIATFNTKYIYLDGIVNPLGKILRLYIGVPVEYQIPLEDCARLMEFIKKNITLDVPQGHEGKFGGFSYSIPVSYLKQ
jgi:hypothetical protein